MSYLRFATKARPLVIPDTVSWCIDPIFRPEPEWFDYFQGFNGRPGGIGTGVNFLAQGFQVSAGTSIETIQVRLGNVAGVQNGAVYLEIVEGATPAGSVVATSSNSVPVNSLNDVSGLVGGENLDVTHPMSTFTFDSPYVSSGGQLYVVMRITEPVTSGVPSARVRAGDPCPGGAAWFYASDDWHLIGTVTDGMDDIEIRVNP